MSDLDDQTLNEFALEFDRCWACGFEGRYGQSGIGLEIHHIQKHLRVHDRWNLSRLCKLCHRSAEGDTIIRKQAYAGRVAFPRLSKAMVLFLKSRFDRDHYDRSALQDQARVDLLPEEERPHSLYEELYWSHTQSVYPGDDIRRMLEM